MKPTPPRLRLAEEALTRILPLVEPADASLRDFFRNRRMMGVQDRGFVAETVWLALRRRRSIEHLAAPDVSPRRVVLAALARFGGISLRELEPCITGGERAWLETVRAAPAAPPEVALDLPDWLIERLSGHLDMPQLESLCRALNQPAPFDLRVNLLKRSREDALDRLRAEGLRAEATPFSPFGVRLKDRIALHQHPLFLDGSLEVQDEGSQLIALLVEPRRQDHVVDFCAGAGGKTLTLGMLMHSRGRLRALDVSEKRLANLRPRLARSGLSNVQGMLIDSEDDARLAPLDGKIDRVLVDAPCTGLGTLRRNPDLKWRQTPQSVAELSALQARILARAARLVRPGGRLVYATCSLLPEENAGVVDAFLQHTPAFSRCSVATLLARRGVPLETGDDLALSPERHGTDGFFAAVLERAAG